MLRYFKNLHHLKTMPLIGLDIAPNGIRLLRLEKNEHSLHVEKFAFQPIPSAVFRDSNITHWDLIHEPLVEIISQTETEGYAAAISMPSHAVIRRNIKMMSSLQPEEVLSEIQNNLTHYLPGIAENEIFFDFSIQAYAHDVQEVLLVATRKTYLQNYIDVIKKSGLVVQVVDADFYALMRAAALCFGDIEKNRGAVQILLDIHAPIATFIAFNDHDVVFYHSWHLEQEHFLSPQNFLSELCQGFKTIWQLCKATHPEMAVSCIGVSGSLAHLDKLSAYIQEELAIPTQCLNPFQNMTLSPSIDALELMASASRSLLCCGLAMRGSIQW